MAIQNLTFSDPFSINLDKFWTPLWRSFLSLLGPPKCRPCLSRSILNHFWDPTGAQNRPLELLGHLWAALGPLLGRSWDPLGRSWAALGRSWALLGRVWDPRGCSWIPRKGPGSSRDQFCSKIRPPSVDFRPILDHPRCRAILNNGQNLTTKPPFH